MVGPSISEEEHRTATTRLRVGFVVLVGVSAGLVAFTGGATPLQALAAVVAGLVVGATLLWWLLRVGREWRGGRERPPRP